MCVDLDWEKITNEQSFFYQELEKKITERETENKYTEKD